VAYADAPDAPRDVALPHRWEDDPGRADYTGAAVNRTTVDIPAERLGDPVRLDLGPMRAASTDATAEDGMRGKSFRAGVDAPVGDVAQVVVNGEERGWAWAPPYSVDITGSLRPGENTITVRVLNTGLGALRTAAGWIDSTVDAVTPTYGKRFAMQDLDRAHHPTRSGLRAAPSLRFVRSRST
jgi:hypothetical protein